MLVEEFAKAVIEEDIGRGDLFERVAPSKKGAAKIVAKSHALLAGQPYVEAIGKLMGIEIVWEKEDGEFFDKKDVIARLYGEAVKLLQAERSILNTLLHASSIATRAREFVELTEGKIAVLDTRKTRPLLRVFEKYAARVGGVRNHRFGLDDALMLKDTHLQVVGAELEAFMQKARAALPFTAKIEVECESVEMAKRAMKAGSDIIMCDNMPIEGIKEVVAFRNEHYRGVLIEASGNITKENIKAYIDLGIDAVSSGSIVHQATWPDISMKMEA